MSVASLSWAFRQSLRPTTKLVLLALADHANDDGECWPGIPGLTRKTGLSDRAIQEHLRKLERAGLLKITPRTDQQGRQISSLYRLAMDGGERRSPGGERRFGEGDERHAPPRVNVVHPNHHRNRQSESSVVVGNDDGTTAACPFDEIVRLYNEILFMCQQVKRLTKRRRRLLSERWAEHPDLGWWRKFFEYVAKSKRLTGQMPKRDGIAYTTRFDWLIESEDNFVNVIEGRYHERGEAAAKPRELPSEKGQQPMRAA